MVDFVRHVVPARRLLVSVPALLPNAMAFTLGVRDNERLKEDVLSLLVAGRSWADFERNAIDYAHRRCLAS